MRGCHTYKLNLGETAGVSELLRLQRRSGCRSVSRRPRHFNKADAIPIDPRWSKLTDADWDRFAAAWIAELRGASPDLAEDVGDSVVMMNFTATPEQQWRFINSALSHAADEELGHVAAGPFEHLMGQHGGDYIELVEEQARLNAKFAKMVTGAWQYMMSDAVWQRVQAIQARATDRLEGDA